MMKDQMNHAMVDYDYKAIDNMVVEFKPGETAQKIEIPVMALDQSDSKRRRMEREIRNMDIKKQ